MRRAAFLAFLLIVILPAAAQTAGKPAPAEGVDLTWGVRIPLRDGVELNATLYRPHGQKEPLPAVFTLTPYTADSYHNRAWYFAQHGYVFLLVDVRGRGNSGGQWQPFENEARDGHDIVEWIARQPWSNGKVAMWGGSYAGFDQWMTLREKPPHLATVVPVASAHQGVDFPMFKNIFTDYDMQWLTLTSGVTNNENLFGESLFWISKFQELYRRQLPFKQLDQVVGNPSPVFQKWMAHPQSDAYWATMGLSPDDYQKISVPILTITGIYDGDQPGAISYYKEHMQYGTAEAKASHYIIIGPWDHPGTRTPRKDVGGLTFGDASLLDMNKLHAEWYDWTMKGGPKPAFLKKRVAYYVTAADEWKYADSLESVAGETRRLYLDSTDGKPNSLYHAGSLSTAKPARSRSDGYVYDPLDLRPADMEKDDIKNSITDQRYILNLYGNGLVYVTEPFDVDTEVSGFLKLTVWIALDVPDTDFGVNVYEQLQDGSVVQLTGDSLRARYRESLAQEKLVKPGEIDKYEFTGFTWTSRRIARGSRLLMVFSSPNTIYVEKNYNSGGVVAEETAKDARTAHVTLYHDAEHPSALEVPIVK